MTTTALHLPVMRQMIEIEGAQLETFQIGTTLGGLVVAAAHPTAAFSMETARVLADTAQMAIVCANPRGIGGSTPAERVSLEQMVDDIESARRRLALPRWVFWGMSGGGWLALIYAFRHPDALAGIIVESACTCFRERLADPECTLSPFFPAWRDALQARGLLVEGSHASPSSADDTEWIEVEGLGQVFRRRDGPALLVSPVVIDRDMKRTMPTLWTFDSRGWIGGVCVPTLVIAGSADPVVPVRRVRYVHEAIPGSSFVVIGGGGHVPSAAQRTEVRDAVRGFIAGRVRA